jgi:enoyl-CoA hydratase
MNPSGRVRAIASHLLPSAVAGEAPTLISETPNVKVERQGRVVIITLVQTKTLNSLSRPLKNDLKAALAAADADQNTGCIILTGSGKAFIAGADIKEMNEMGLVEITQEDLSVSLQPVSTCQVPIIAAVNGFAFGGGCEIAMM